jgi:hypothetical protein
MLVRNTTVFYLAIILMLAGILSGCRKEETIVISGLMFDPNQEIPVGQVKVELWTQEIEGGIFSANYVLYETVNTGNDGMFIFNPEKKNYTGIRLIFSKEGYYGWEADVNIDKVNQEKSHYAEYQLLPEARLRIRVKNTQPFDADDYFEFRILNGYTSCAECCKGEKYQFTGSGIDQTIDCRSAGHQDILIQWSKRKNNEQVIKTESFFIEAFKTTEINFNY